MESKPVSDLSQLSSEPAFSETLASNNTVSESSEPLMSMAPSFDPSEFDQVLNSHKIVIFTLSYCPYCKKAKEYLNDKGVSYYNVELDSMEN